jgi:hypothetical protein
MLSAADTWSLTAIAAATGVLLGWVWRRFSDRARVAQAVRQTRARLYAVRLYADDPGLVFRAQRQLLWWTWRYLVLMLRPTAVAIVPLFVLFPLLDDAYGHRPLAPGESAVLTAQFDAGADVSTLAAVLEGRGVVVETPGVRIPSLREVCWRVRAVTSAPGSVLLRMDGATIGKAVKCGHWPGSPSIDVSCPAASLDIFGFGIAWPVWFLAVSGITMLVARRG